MKGTVKANTVDKYLRPIRSQIRDLIPENSRVVEFGCGNGDLLFWLADKIALGRGFDVDKSLVAFANKHKEATKANNLHFEVADVSTKMNIGEQYDFAISSLLLHILPHSKAVQVIETLLTHSKSLIICGFSSPQNWKQHFLLWLDQRFTNHYPKFKKHRESGYTEGLLEAMNIVDYDRIDTFDPVIKVYRIDCNHQIDKTTIP